MTPSDLLSRGRLEVKSGPLYSITLKGNTESYYSLESQPTSFHFAIWLSTNDVSNFKFTTTVNFSEDDCSRDRTILFGEQKDYEDFLEWRKEYGSRFPENDMDSVTFPQMPKSGRYNLTFVDISNDGDDEDRPARSVREKVAFELWGWIVNNCRGMVFQIDVDRYAFEHEEEAFLFKMMHHE